MDPAAQAPAITWAQIQASYRCWLYEEGAAVLDEHGKIIQRGFAPETADLVINRQQGQLARRVLARERLRHFTEGVTIGSRQFIEDLFQARLRGGIAGMTATNTLAPLGARSSSPPPQ